MVVLKRYKEKRNCSASSIRVIGICFYVVILSSLGCWLMLFHSPLRKSNDSPVMIKEGATSKQYFFTLENERFMDPETIFEIAEPIYGTKFEVIDEYGAAIEAVYAFPEVPPSQIKGVILLLHACTHNALKFYSPSPEGCPGCFGLSEELRIVRLSQQRGYATLAVSSNEKSGCWSNKDFSRIRKTLSKFRQHFPGAIADKPTFAIGASSGGHMAAEAAIRGIADAALVMVMSLNKVTQENLAKSSLIPIYLAPMPRDIGTTKGADKNFKAILDERKSETIILDKTSCLPLAVTEKYLISRIPNITQQDAKEIVETLKIKKYIDQDHFFIQDPTRSQWRDLLISRRDSITLDGHILWGRYEIAPGKSPLAKALHRAWAFHEYCSESVPLAISFFEKHKIPRV